MLWFLQEDPKQNVEIFGYQQKKVCYIYARVQDGDW